MPETYGITAALRELGDRTDPQADPAARLAGLADRLMAIHRSDWPTREERDALLRAANALRSLGEEMRVSVWVAEYVAQLRERVSDLDARYAEFGATGRSVMRLEASVLEDVADRLAAILGDDA